ncbi:MAG: ribonuclease III [Chloroflexi bacterium]|nr:MAG: ribonuclease III [Chloroflexota bacterium]TME46508.1 MAG: ribonuclease III [Chloroflexota bacterium]
MTRTPKRFRPSEPPGTTSRKSSASPPEPKLAQADEPLQKLQRTLRIRFHDVALLRQALTHRSYNNEHPESGSADNERLEYLGDAVLELIAAEHLYHTYQTSDEGELTRLRASVVNTKSLARLASRLSLGDYLLLGKGAHKTGARSLQSILANTFEAVIGAIFLDQGYRAAYRLFSRSLIDVQAWPDDNYKGRLQEVTQERFLTTPQYEIIGASGPGHRREYTSEVTFGDGIRGVGTGRTKRAAEQMAAREALASLGALDQVPAEDEVLDAVAAEARRGPSA